MIRPIQAKDKEIYLSLTKEFYRSPAVDHSVPIENFENTFNECLTDNPYCHAVVVEYNDIVVGFGLLAVTYSNEAGGMVVWLEELFILEEYRSHGLGKEFFAYVETKYPNAARYRLEVARSNTRAIKLYSRLGYSELDYLQMITDKHNK